MDRARGLGSMPLVDARAAHAMLVMVMLVASACTTTPEALRKADAECDLQWGYSQITNHEHGRARGGQIRATLSVFTVDPFEVGVVLGYGQDVIDIQDRVTDDHRNLVLNEYLGGLQARANLFIGDRVIPFIDVTSGLAYVARRGDASLEEVFGEAHFDQRLNPFVELGSGVRLLRSDDAPGGVELALRLRGYNSFIWPGAATQADTSVNSLVVSVGFTCFF